jgi:hypothetical protein
MTDSLLGPSRRQLGEYRFVLVGSFVALVITSIPYLLGAALATKERIFGGFVYAVEDCYSYLAKMRQGAEGAWLFHIPYTPEPHPGAVIYSFYLLLGKIAPLLPVSSLTSGLVWVYHVARGVFGLGLLMTVYRFLAAFTERVIVRRLAWLMVTFGGGLGWLLIALGRSNWLGSLPLDFILPEGFTFLVLYALPHIALGRTLLLWGLLFLCKAWRLGRWNSDLQNVAHSPLPTLAVRWAVLAGFLWLLMGLIVPFYVAVSWAVLGASWIVLALRRRRLPWDKAALAGMAALISAPPVVYSAWRFTSHPVYQAWASQNRVFSPHPLHYLIAYGIPLALAAFAVEEVWHSKRGSWLLLTWVGVVPFLVYLPFNLQRRLVEGVQVPLSMLAAVGLTKIMGVRSGLPDLRWRLAVSVLLITLLPTNAMLIAGNALALRGLPGPIYRDGAEVTALDWLSQQVEPDDVVLASYETGNYLPARVGARAFVGHGPESVQAAQKKVLAAQFFDAATHRTWRQQLLAEYGIDYVFWGPTERDLGSFVPQGADYLQRIYEQDGYLLFEVIQ